MGRYTHPIVSPPFLPSNEEIIAGIVRADPTPPDVHINPDLAGHEGIVRLGNGDNEVDDIVASAVESNVTTNTGNTSIGIHIGVNRIHVFIVNLIISVTASASCSLFDAYTRFLGVERDCFRRRRCVRCGSNQATQQSMP
ncbi:hypothetical protein RSOLAG22IIIB_12593 [Rhizoctonia solani]|uniref:Uncharacterized protein n=1 Tax=Rhizoctonia solani TaxID=456999 RepID=A0A0K6GFP1_9AGAM|nr:hypothetical protein RSOLAG22IIIB_12593 [Rhizoctonia solani]